MTSRLRRLLWLAPVLVALTACRATTAMDAYSASQGYYYPPPPTPAPTTTTCYRVINQIVCETR